MKQETPTWKALKEKVIVQYDPAIPRKVVSQRSIEALQHLHSVYGPNNPYLGSLMTRKQHEEAIQKDLNGESRLGGARDNYDLPSIPKYLPYNPIPVFGAPPLLQQSNVRDMRVFLQQPPYNWPLSVGDNVNDWANAANLPFGSILQYQHQQTPPALVKRITIVGSYAQIAYDPNASSTEAASFFSDNNGDPRSTQWNLEFITASQIRYNTPPEPDTYPNNRILYWNNTAKLTAECTAFYRSIAPNQFKTDVWPTNPAEENIFQWVFELPKGIRLDTNDYLRLITGYPTIVNGNNQFDKLYITADMEIIDFNINSQEVKRAISILITLANENQTVGL